MHYDPHQNSHLCSEWCWQLNPLGFHSHQWIHRWIVCQQVSCINWDDWLTIHAPQLSSCFPWKFLRSQICLVSVHLLLLWLLPSQPLFFFVWSLLSISWHRDHFQLQNVRWWKKYLKHKCYFEVQPTHDCYMRHRFFLSHVFSAFLLLELFWWVLWTLPLPTINTNRKSISYHTLTILLV